VITALADRSLHIGPVITHDYPLSQGLEAFTTAKNSAQSGKVLLNFQPQEQ
ncbi:MAG: L-idonate 5-dehydrogenase, partial [Pseudarthrobacter sp.]|nr:L-idonate 5-dehydrogenase [Pseudarthrobacter sp.]